MEDSSPSCRRARKAPRRETAQAARCVSNGAVALASRLGIDVSALARELNRYVLCSDVKRAAGELHLPQQPEHLPEQSEQPQPR